MMRDSGCAAAPDALDILGRSVDETFGQVP
jgi:hypothetical protein